MPLSDPCIANLSAASTCSHGSRRIRQKQSAACLFCAFCVRWQPGQPSSFFPFCPAAFCPALCRASCGSYHPFLCASWTPKSRCTPPFRKRTKRPFFPSAGIRGIFLKRTSMQALSSCRRIMCNCSRIKALPFAHRPPISACIFCPFWQPRKWASSPLPKWRGACCAPWKPWSDWRNGRGIYITGIALKRFLPCRQGLFPRWIPATSAPACWPAPKGSGSALKAWTKKAERCPCGWIIWQKKCALTGSMTPPAIYSI